LSAPLYPRGAVLALLDTPHLSAATRAAWEKRLHPAALADPVFFSLAAFATLRAVEARLVTPVGGIDTGAAACLDAQLAASEGPGWRYDTLPPDAVSYRDGIAAIDASAVASAGLPFAEFGAEAQDALLHDVQRGAAPGAIWAGLDQRRFFEMLLAALTEFQVAHPAVQDAIGCAAAADLPEWTAIGLGEREPREPEAIR